MGKNLRFQFYEILKINFFFNHNIYLKKIIINRMNYQHLINMEKRNEEQYSWIKMKIFPAHSIHLLQQFDITVITSLKT